MIACHLDLLHVLSVVVSHKDENWTLLAAALCCCKYHRLGKYNSTAERCPF